MSKIPTILEAGTANNVLAYSEHIVMKEGNLKNKSVAEILNKYNDNDKPNIDDNIKDIRKSYQKKLTAGTGIQITDEGMISATGDSISVVNADGVNYTEPTGIKSNAKEQFDKLFYSIKSKQLLNVDNLVDIDYDLNNLQNNTIYKVIIPSTESRLLNKPVPTTGMSGLLITIGYSVSRSDSDMQLMLFNSYHGYSIHIRYYNTNHWDDWIEIRPTIDMLYKDKNITYTVSKIFGYKGYIKSTSSDYKLSSYFNIKDNISIISSFASEIGFSRVVFYDDDFNYIGEITNDTLSGIKNIILKFGDNCPTNAKYARASLTSSGYIKYNDNYTTRDYKLYDVIYKLTNNINNNASDINDINDIVHYLKDVYMDINEYEILSPINEFTNYAQYPNKIDYMTEIKGYYIYEYDISNRPINYISVNAYQGEPSNRSVIFLDNNKTIIESISTPKGYSINNMLRVPNNATYVRIQAVNNNSKCVLVNYTDKLITKEVNITASYVSDSGYYINPNQTIGDTVKILEMKGTTYHIYDIPINKSVKVNINKVGTYGYCLAKKEDNTVLEYYSSQYSSEIITKKYNFETQLYASSSKLLSIYLLEQDTLHHIVENLYNNNNNNNNYWTDKKIWWCGTSIPAGTGSPLGIEAIKGSYPKEVGVILNCTVYNEAVGGSMCRANVRTGNYAGLNYDNITSALTRTKEENEYFINNYDTIKNIPQNAAFPDSINSSYLNRLRKASFEDKILPLLANDNIDLFVIDHGHNDFKYKMPDGTSDINLMPTVNNINDGILAEDTYMTNNNYERLAYFLGFYKKDDNTKGDGDALKNRLKRYNFNDFVASLNRNCFIGSINFLMTVILSRKPNARFMFVSNYEYKNGRYTSYSPVIEAQHYLSDSWAFPICDVYKYLGFSNHIVPHSKEYLEKIFTNKTKTEYVQGLIDNNADTIAFNIYNCDEVHPHTDISGTSTKIYAGILSEFIKTCR